MERQGWVFVSQRLPPPPSLAPDTCCAIRVVRLTYPALPQLWNRRHSVVRCWLVYPARDGPPNSGRDRRDVPGQDQAEGLQKSCHAGPGLPSGEGGKGQGTAGKAGVKLGNAGLEMCRCCCCCYLGLRTYYGPRDSQCEVLYYGIGHVDNHEPNICAFISDVLSPHSALTL